MTPLLAWRSGGWRARIRAARRLARDVRSRDAASLAAVATTGLPDEVAPLAAALNALLALRARSTPARLRRRRRARAALAADRAEAAVGCCAARRAATRRRARRRSRRSPPDRSRGAADRAAADAGAQRAAAPPAPPSPSIWASWRAGAGRGAHAAPRGSELVLDAEPVVVAGDRGALAALIRNLVDNAIRYSPRARGWRCASVHDDGAPLLQVDDAGPGIPPAERERVFDRFYRRNAARTGDRAARAPGSAWRSFAASPTGTARASSSAIRRWAACA